ncbi:MAG: M20/M25/M40 family metallo-hydrolase [Myxococcales bacterium]|nr:M20/M25/M40 family metallo-hydrolase [Myxococcales bacterium]
MRWRALGFGVLVLAAGCNEGASDEAVDAEQPPAEQPSGCASDDPLSRAALEADIVALARPEMQGRAPGSAQDGLARTHIADRFDCLELEAPEGEWEQPFVSDEGKSTANVIGILRGSDPDVRDEVIVIAAHHDHLGRDNAGVYAGANDDASGIAVMLAAAAALTDRNTPPRRTIAFIAFGAEEEGFVGSERFADDPPEGLAMDDIVFMLNLDMVGSYAQEDVLYGLNAFPGTPGNAALTELAEDFPDLNLELGDASDLSDHVTFCEAGVPTTFLWTSDEECYHKPCDRPERIDWVNTPRVAELTLALLEDLADGERDLATAREAGCGEP